MCNMCDTMVVLVREARALHALCGATWDASHLSLGAIPLPCPKYVHHFLSSHRPPHLLPTAPPQRIPLFFQGQRLSLHLLSLQELMLPHTLLPALPRTCVYTCPPGAHSAYPWFFKAIVSVSFPNPAQVHTHSPSSTLCPHP